MLGRLARWLRVVGQDAAYGPHLSGAALVGLARREGRTILTRDTRLVRRRDLPPHLFIESEHFREQLRQVIGTFGLEVGPGVFTRCLDCNQPLREVDRARVHLRVPPFVWATQDRFVTCPRCRRLFWPATHLARMRDELAHLGLLPSDGATAHGHSPK
jgi:uncharacterized protein with PIN domain